MARLSEQEMLERLVKQALRDNSRFADLTLLRERIALARDAYLVRAAACARDEVAADFSVADLYDDSADRPDPGVDAVIQALHFRMSHDFVALVRLSAWGTLHTLSCTIENNVSARILVKLQMRKSKNVLEFASDDIYDLPLFRLVGFGKDRGTGAPHLTALRPGPVP